MNIFIFIHEAGHIIGAILFGGYFYSLGYGSVIVLPGNLLSFYTMLVGGPMLSISLAFIISRKAKNKDKEITYVVMNCIIMYELILWTVSPFLGKGDSHVLLGSLGIWYKGCLLEFKNLIVIIPFIALSCFAFIGVANRLLINLRIMRIDTIYNINGLVNLYM